MAQASGRDATMVLDMAVPAHLDEVPAVVAAVAEAARRAGLAPEVVSYLELAVEEAATNVCQYAYPEAPGDLQVRVQENEAQVTVELIDAGPVFDPLALPLPDTGVRLEERSIGGLGVFLIRQFVDDLHYQRRDARNVLQLVMHKEA